MLSEERVDLPGKRVGKEVAMNAFIVKLENRPGEVARVTETLAAQGINILVYGLAVGGYGALGFVANDEQGARSALDDAGVAYREVPIVAVRMEDRPGQAAKVSRQLADAGLNLELWLPVDTSQASFTVALGVDDVEAAQRVLGDQVVGWSYG